MPSAETFNQVVRRLQEFANGHYILDGAFYFGQLEEADADKISQYPYMHVQPTSVTKARGTNRFDFDIYFMDRPKRTEDQYDQMRDGLSDTLQISHDLVAMIDQGQLFGSRVETSLANGITAQPLMKETKHSLDGWLLQLGIIVPASLNACDVPGDFEFVTSGSSSGGGLGNYMLKSVYDTNNNGCVDCADEIDGIDGAAVSTYYGKNGAGTAGFHALPSASIADGDKGDIIVSGGGTNWSIDDEAVDTDKIADNAVDNTKLQNMALNTIKGNDAVLGDPKDLTANEATALLKTATDPFARVSELPTGNATHTGEVTGATVLTVDKTAISNRTQEPIVPTDIILFGDTSDSANLKKDNLDSALCQKLEETIIVNNLLGGVAKCFALRSSPLEITTNLSLGNQVSRVIPVYIPRDMTLTGAKFYIITQGNYTGNNYNGIALYKSDGIGGMDLVASTTNDTELWKGASGSWTTKAFSSTYNAAKGMYWVYLLYCQSAQTTAPIIGACPSSLAVANTTFDHTNNYKLWGSRSVQTTAPASIPHSAITGTINRPFIALY